MSKPNRLALIKKVAKREIEPPDLTELNDDMPDPIEPDPFEPDPFEPDEGIPRMPPPKPRVKLGGYAKANPKPLLVTPRAEPTIDNPPREIEVTFERVLPLPEQPEPKPFKLPDPVPIPEGQTCWDVVLPMALPVIVGLFLPPDHPDYNPEAEQPFGKRSLRTMMAHEILCASAPSGVSSAKFKFESIAKWKAEQEEKEKAAALAAAASGKEPPPVTRQSRSDWEAMRDKMITSDE
jgi:hypothetical protein